ncbi:GAF domain-containing protein [Gloeocapsopsis sp. IPPAS B-1203]|uniref:GAF domain-containing protein n=1 Tax=Gloeocapsopsis sp. IPPAS B-1203 TaxID=2049454 RepID=UPI0025A1DBE7|nr:GAF domain-containing protein [Gloeocapsopsis sp. IPPAS B-1203]
MTSAPLPHNESERIEALRRYKILDTPPEESFDRITALAARLFNVPVALVSFVDEFRAWFKSSYGFDSQQISRQDTICSIAVLSNEVFVVPDTREDPRFACKDFALCEETGIRFYAGAPLITNDGFNLGTICLVDRKPRHDFNLQQQATLADLAAIVVDELELRFAAHKVSQMDTALLEVTEGVSAATGEAFFASLVKHLTQALGVEYAFVGELVEQEEKQTIRTIAIYAQNEITDNIEYSLLNTPCQHVIQLKKPCCYPRNIQAEFPDNYLLAQMKVDSYFATPLLDSAGRVLGLLGIMACKPLENIYLAQPLLTIFATRATAELERTHLLNRERHHTRQLHGLTEAALAINSALSVEEVLQVITEQARSIIGAHQSVTSMSVNQNWPQAINAVSLSQKYAQWRSYDQKPDGSGIYACVCHINRPMRMTQAELEVHPRWQGFGRHAAEHPPMRGWLAAPLTGRDGYNIGLIQLSDKYIGEFTQEDEAIIVQLAQMASVAVENARLYAAEQQARTQAETANRLKDEFLAVLSHELRSPLNPILGWSKLLLTHNFDATKTHYALETIERNAKLQSQLIEDLLDVSRILRGKLSLNITSVDLATVITAAIETVRLAAEAKAIELIIDFELIQVWGDANRLQQVVWNLLSNAVKFTPVGGRVEVKLDGVFSDLNSESDAEYLIQNSLRDPNQSFARICVSDTGRGIDPEFLPFVFDYFRQADSTTTRSFGGLGLGLAIVRYLVELHGGTVQAESQGAGQGAIFKVILPLGSVATPSCEQQTSDEDMPTLQGIKVLVVDDEEDTRDLIVFVLEEYGATVCAVASATEAIEIFTQKQTDILLSDIGMPEMDGYTLIRTLRSLPQAEGSEIAAIALTAYAGETNHQQILAAGFQKHLAKPVEPEELVKAIAQLVK